MQKGCFLQLCFHRHGQRVLCQRGGNTVAAQAADHRSALPGRFFVFLFAATHVLVLWPDLAPRIEKIQRRRPPRA